jgi:transcriptional regulator with XRE-family HTH domain
MQPANPATEARETVVTSVRVLMALRRMSGVQLAERIGLSQSAFSRRMNCEMPFDADEIAQVAAVFEVPIATLFAGTHPGPTHPAPTGPSQPPKPKGQAA